MPKSYDVIVVGLGTMGSAACYHLMKRGVRVLGLEQFGIPHNNGSGHGYSRMIRTAYHEHPDYVPLLQSAFRLWRELEAESGEKILHVTGGVYMGDPQNGLPQHAREAAEQHGLPYEWLDRAALRSRFPQFVVPDHFAGIVEPNAGFIIPEKAIASHALLALRGGADLRGHEPVIAWEEDAAKVTVTTARGTYCADQVLFCGGAWTDRLIRDLGVRLVVTRQVLGWVWPKRPELFAYGRLPVWAFSSPDARGEHYGFPMMPDNPGFKLAHHTPLEPCDPDTVVRAPQPGDEDTFRTVLQTMIPEADGPLLSLRVCLYTNSPDRHFIVDRHPRHARVTVACGFSGHGFKFASVMGEALAELTRDGATQHPIGFLGLRRFAPAKPNGAQAGR